MSLTEDIIADGRRYQDIINLIEMRDIVISGVKTHLRVLSIHPSDSSEGDGKEVVLRLVLRPDKSSDKDSKLDIVRAASTEARLHELGLTYPIRLNEDIESQVKSLVSAVKRDTELVLKESSPTKESSVEPSYLFIHQAIPVAVSLVAGVAAAFAWNFLSESFRWSQIRWENFSEVFRAAALVVVILLVYRFISARLVAK